MSSLNPIGVKVGNLPAAKPVANTIFRLSLETLCTSPIRVLYGEPLVSDAISSHYNYVMN